MIRGAIFDLDGTLVDSEPIYAESDGAFLAEHGIALVKDEYVGVGTRDFFRDLERRFPESPLNALPFAERVRRKDARYLEAAAGRLRAFAPVVELAAGLARRGVALALASGSSPEVIAAALAEAGLASLFELALSASDLPRGKPEPDLFLEAARRLGLPPEDCLVVEDSRFGVIAAHRAGMRCVALPPPGGGALHADFGLAGLVVPGGPEALDPASLIAKLEEWGLPLELSSS